MYEPYEDQESQQESVYHFTLQDTLPEETQDMPPKTAAKKQRKGLTGGKVVAIALVCSLLGGIIGASGMFLGAYLLEQGSISLPGTEQGIVSDPDTDPTTGTSPNSNSGLVVYEGVRGDSVIDVSKVDTSKPMTIAEVYATNVNSTVGITTSITTNFWGYQTTAAASGSGFIFSKDGYVLTNFHVVEDSSSITVSMYDGTTYDAALVGYDESNDVAVLKIDAQNLTPVVLGNSDNLNVGDSVVAIGNPLGELTFSLTAGAISAKDREITMSNGITMRLFQTDCAINSGNSGGALFNLYGEVIGITNAKYSSNSSTEASIDNIGFAIPINKARSIAESIIEKGYVSRPYIGVSVTTVSEESQSYGLPQGAAVRSVAEGGPAAAGGLKANDIITHINGTQIADRTDLVDAVNNAKAGDVLKLTVYRKGSILELSITVGEQIQSSQTQQSAKPQNTNPWGF